MAKESLFGYRYDNPNHYYYYSRSKDYNGQYGYDYLYGYNSNPRFAHHYQESYGTKTGNIFLNAYFSVAVILGVFGISQLFYPLIRSYYTGRNSPDDLCEFREEYRQGVVNVINKVLAIKDYFKDLYEHPQVEQPNLVDANTQTFNFEVDSMNENQIYLIGDEQEFFNNPYIN